VTVLLFVVAGAALALTGVFRLDCGLHSHACRTRFDGGQLSWHTYAHVWVGLAGQLALLATPFALARALWPSPLAAFSLGAGGFGVLVGAAGELAYGLSAPAGVTQRLELVPAHVWIVLVAGGILYVARQRRHPSAHTPLRPRDFFATSWAGDGDVVGAWPLVGRLLRVHFTFTREWTFLSDEFWMLEDRAVLDGGRVEEQRLFCQLVGDRIHVCSDRIVGGTELLLDDQGYSLFPFRYLVPIGPLHITLRCRQAHTLEPDGTLVNTVRSWWLGIPIARVTARGRRVNPGAEASARAQAVPSTLA
jgi:hypothetical protein